MIRKLVITGAAAAALLIPATAANASVLINAPDTHPYCGDAIKVGTWAQSWTTGNRHVTITARYLNSGRVFWRRIVVASKRNWNFYYIAPYNCANTKITYSGPGWSQSYRIYFGVGD